MSKKRELTGEEISKLKRNLRLTKMIIKNQSRIIGTKKGIIRHLKLQLVAIRQKIDYLIYHEQGEVKGIGAKRNSICKIIKQEKRNKPNELPAKAKN